MVLVGLWWKFGWSCGFLGSFWWILWFWCASGGIFGSLVDFWCPPDHQEFHQKHPRATKSTRNPPETFNHKNSPEIPPEFHQSTQTSTTNQPEPQNPPEIHHPEFHQKHFRTTKSASNRTEIKQTTQNSTRDTSPHHHARNQPETLHKCSINLPEILHLASINLPYQ